MFRLWIKWPEIGFSHSIVLLVIIYTFSSFGVFSDSFRVRAASYLAEISRFLFLSLAYFQVILASNVYLLSIVMIFFLHNFWLYVLLVYSFARITWVLVASLNCRIYNGNIFFFVYLGAVIDLRIIASQEGNTILHSSWLSKKLGFCT